MTKNTKRLKAKKTYKNYNRKYRKTYKKYNKNHNKKFKRGRGPSQENHLGRPFRKQTQTPSSTRPSSTASSRTGTATPRFPIFRETSSERERRIKKRTSARRKKGIGDGLTA